MFWRCPRVTDGKTEAPKERAPSPAVHGVGGFQSLAPPTNYSPSREEKTGAHYWLFVSFKRNEIHWEQLLRGTLQWPIWSGIFHDQDPPGSQSEDHSDGKQRLPRAPGRVSTEGTQTTLQSTLGQPSRTALRGLWQPHTQTYTHIRMCARTHTHTHTPLLLPQSLQAV